MTGDLIALAVANAALIAGGHGVLRLAGIRPVPGDLAWSRRLGAASAEIFWRLADEMRAGVLDNFFHRAFAHRLESLAGPVLEVHCACPAGLALERYQSRQRHPCHFDLSYGVDMFEQWSRSDAGPLALGGPLLEIDTTRPVDVGAIAAWVRDRVT